MRLPTLRRSAPAVQRALTYQQLWNTGLDWAPKNTIAGVSVSMETALNASAVWACVRLLSNDIAGLPLDAYRRLADGGRQPIRLPAFLERPSPNPNVTRDIYVQMVVTSLLLDGNAFVYVLPDATRPQEVRVLDPGTVTVRTNGGETTYRVQGSDRELTPEEIVHIPWIILPGKNRGMNPIDAARETIGMSLAADQYGAAYFGNGATLSMALKAPPDRELTDEQIEALQRQFERRHIGARKSHAVGVLTGGLEVVDMAKSNRDSQFLELRRYQVEDVGRLYGVPPHMIGSQEPGAVAYASVEQRSIDYVTHAVQPIVERLETAHERLLRGQRTFVKFNLEGLKRGDQKSRYDAWRVALETKFMTRDEVRAKEDLEPLGLGFLETPNNNAPAPAEPPDTEQESAPVQLSIAEAIVRDERPAPILNVAPAEVIVPPPDLSRLETLFTAMAERLAEMEARIANPVPIDKVIDRDEQGRIIRVHERRGAKVTRTEVERDPDGRIATVRSA